MRAFVGPNTVQMKAARYILSQPGITLAKSSILCGGPDWPTSVICGLLGLDCCSMLVGLVPIIVFTTPGILPEEAWAPLAALVRTPQLLEVEGGVVKIPTFPGLGIDVDEEAVERYRVRDGTAAAVRK